MMEYQSFDPAPCGFPKPRVPVLPLLGGSSLGLHRQARLLALAQAPNARFYTRGRYAMTEAYRLCGVGAGSTLLAPAYHCRTMLDPAIRLGADVVLYPLGQDLKPDLEGLAACVAKCAKPVSALLVTHYFGFRQPLTELLEWCRSVHIDLIEDCSHCLFLPCAQDDLGRQARYSVSSPYKFFPIEEGGVLWANHDGDLPARRPEAQGLVRELKGMARALQRAVAATPALDLNLPDQATANSPETPVSTGYDRLQVTAGHSGQYEVAAEHLGGLASSALAMRHTRLDRLVARRRSNYGAWAQCVAHLPNCHALYPDLPEGTVPYMFALHIARPDVHFFALKRLGVPVWRWDDMAISGCGVSMNYRTHLLHLPCHQELTEQQMQWMMSAVAAVMAMVAAEVV